MQIKNVAGDLSRNKNVFASLFEDFDEELIFWKQNPKKWCLLEIICHLYDEEREDFRARLKSTLEDPSNDFQPIDPVEWIGSRKYIEQNFHEKIEQFLYERDNSITFLNNLENPKWENYYSHPNFGKMSAEYFLNNWLAHDYLHIRQIIKLKYDYLNSNTADKLNYAGSW